MALFQNNLLMGAASQSSDSSYSIDQSIRYNPDDSAYMHKTYSGAGDRTAWTFSTWFKLGKNNFMTTSSGLYYVFFSCDAGTSDANRGIFSINNDSSDSANMQIQFQGHGTIFLKTNRKLRDPSAWYHITLVWDSDNTYAPDRCRLYINGERETSFATQNNPTSGQEIGINTANTHRLGAGYNISGGSVVYYFDGYMAETVFLDGTAATASSFGEFKEDSNIWVPKDVSDLTFGTNGFWIDGRDSSDLGDDESGRGNDYATSGLAAHDQVFDTPVNNFCVLNPIDKPTYGSYAAINVTNTNLQVTENGDGTVQSYGFGTMVPSSGKWYYEVYTNTYPGGNAIGIGWIENENAQTATDSGNAWLDVGINQRHTTSAYTSWTWGLNSQTATGLTPFGQGVTIGVTTDFDNNTFTITKDGSAYGSVDFDSTSPTYSFSGVEHRPFLTFNADGASLATVNFGQDSTFSGALSAGGNSDANGHGNFKYSVPSGALAICSKNLGS